MSFKVYPYKTGSKSAKLLAQTLGCKVLKREGSSYVPKPGDVVINWGSSSAPDFQPATTLNTPSSVKVAGNKLLSLQRMRDADVRIPPFSVDLSVAPLSYPVVCRTVLSGHSGAGIVVADSHDEVVAAPLYTQYVKKKDEYRVHCFRGQVFFVQRKARKHGFENPDWQVRNLAGGFSFVEVPRREDNPELAFDAPLDVMKQALAAMEALGLDFGGVDVMWNAQQQKAYVLEVNCACGLEQRTADKYAKILLDNI